MTNVFTSKYRQHNNIFITAEHASSWIPKKYEKLGLSDDEIKRSKDLYDPGVGEILKNVVNGLGASYLFSNVSRLVVDCNRGLKIGDGIGCASVVKKKMFVGDGEGEKVVDVPLNLRLNYDGVVERYEKYVLPYKERGVEIVDRLLCKFGGVYIFPIHSFYPVYMGEKRDVDIGLIHGKGVANVAQVMVRGLRLRSDLKIECNKPWSWESVGGGIFSGVCDDSRVSLIGIEVNVGIIKDDNGIKMISDLLEKAILDVVSKDVVV